MVSRVLYERSTISSSSSSSVVSSSSSSSSSSRKVKTSPIMMATTTTKKRKRRKGGGAGGEEDDDDEEEKEERYSERERGSRVIGLELTDGFYAVRANLDGRLSQLANQHLLLPHSHETQAMMAKRPQVVACAR